jgi:hypothetical protein
MAVKMAVKPLWWALTLGEHEHEHPI